MNSNDDLEFKISGRDLKNVKKFQRLHKNCSKGMAFDQFEYSFVPTSFGVLGTVKCSCGRKMTVGSFMDHEPEEFNPAKYGVMTMQDHENERLEQSAELILNLKNPRIFRMSYMMDQTFQMVADLAFAMAICTDKRLVDCIPQKYSTDDKLGFLENCASMEDKDKIQVFFRFFEEHLRELLEGYGCQNEHLLGKISPENGQIGNE